MLIDDPYIFVAFISPSGNGIKCIINIGQELKAQNFEYIGEYFYNKYQVQIDKRVKDESRLCFYSYDPDIYVNYDYLIFQLQGLTFQPNMSVYENEVESLISSVESQKIDITSNYDNWLMIAFALSSEFGIDGEKYYHRLSRFYPGYNYNECSKQYQNCLSAGSKKIRINKLISYIKSFLNIESKGIETETSKLPEDFIKFFTPSFDKDGELKDIRIEYTKWIEVLYRLGIRRFDIDKNFIFVRINNQIVEEVSVTHIQDIFINYLEKLPEKLGEGVTREALISKFYRNPSHYFCESRFNLLRPKEQFDFAADTKDNCLIYFRNGFVSCDSNGYTLNDYANLKGLIWKNQIVDNDFTELNFTSLTPVQRGEFSHFIYNICNNDYDRYESLLTIIGYLMHSHFVGKLKAVIFTDSKISNAPNGRTGKTLLGQALGYLKKYSEINGKDFDPTNKHKYQEVNLDTQIVHLNDVRKNFDFETLFNDITEGIVVDKKNVKPFKVKAKIIVSTNKTIKVEGASGKDRAIEFEFADYYNEDFSPETEFGHWFFRDWSNDEWAKFYNLLLYSICLYFKKGLIVASPVNLNKRKLLETTNEDFVEFMDSQVREGLIKAGIEYDKKELLERFLSENPEYLEVKSFKQRRFTDFLRAYSKYSGKFSPIVPEIHERKCGANRYIIFPQL